MFLIAQTEATGGGGTGLLLYVVLFAAVIYFLMIRPQRNRVRQQWSLVSRLEIGDQVQTVGGMRGVVIGIEADNVLLGIEEGRVRVAMPAIATRMSSQSDELADEQDDEA